MANYFVFLFLVGMMVYGMGNPTTGERKAKRSDILVHDVVQQMVAEQIERQKILKEFSGMKHELSDVKRELKERNTLIRDTEFLHKKLLRKAKQMLAKTKQLRKNIKREIGEIRHKSSKKFKLINTVIADLLNKTSNNGKQVAFSATLTHHATFSSAIIFNKVIMNIGGGYNNRDGMFYCPRPGLYLLSTSVTALGNQDVFVFLMKNHKQVTRAYERIGHSLYPSASVTIVLRLKTGDKIWIKGFGIKYHNHDNTFTGVLIKP